MIYLVLSYKYNEYRIYSYMQEIVSLNQDYIEKIQSSREVLENKTTKAYKNKILKSQQGLKNPGEEVVFLITEEKYKKYTETPLNTIENNYTPQDLLDEKSLIETMTIYERWIYMLFQKDIR